VDVVINLTVPAAHATITLAALEEGKHVFSEKPLALDREQGRRILEVADERGLRVGCAPDTLLGPSHQGGRRLLDSGEIGDAVSASAAMMYAGPELWHPDPAFFFQPGAGPLFDMGPYYLSWLVMMLGPVARVSCRARILFPERIVKGGPRKGETIHVTTPTHVAAILEFEGGQTATLLMSFGVPYSKLPHLELQGTSGTLQVPDPNHCVGPVSLWSEAEPDGRVIEVPQLHQRGWCQSCRCMGVVDLVEAAAAGREPRASGRIAYHVLDVMHSLYEASDANAWVDVESTCARPEPMPAAEPAPTA
jgi:predicted dehydrogenase